MSYDDFIDFVDEVYGEMADDAYIDLISLSIGNLLSKRLINVTDDEIIKNIADTTNDQETLYTIIGAALKYAQLNDLLETDEDVLKDEISTTTDQTQEQIDFGIDLSKPKNAWER